MKNAVAQNGRGQTELDAASVRAALGNLHLLVAQSKLLALNTALESHADLLRSSAGACAGAAAAETERLVTEVGSVVTEADRVTSAIEVLLQQIHAGASYAPKEAPLRNARHCA